MKVMKKETAVRTAKKSNKTVHMCITVPEKLRVRMNKFQKKVVVNWSAVACKQFRKVILDHEKQNNNN